MNTLPAALSARLLYLPTIPVEFTEGIKIYPARWWGFGAWFRRALNDQRAKNLNGVDASVAIQQITNVNVINRGLVVVPGTSRVATAAGVPLAVPSALRRSAAAHRERWAAEGGAAAASI